MEKPWNTKLSHTTRREYPREKKKVSSELDIIFHVLASQLPRHTMCSKLKCDVITQK